MPYAINILTDVLETISGYLWHEYVLYFILFVGILFTIWSGFCQWRALTHGVQVVRGKYDDKSDPGAINHFQALSAALSATVGIGNIGGVAGAIAIGGPGAVFWMWVVGVIGMALKTVECTLAMLYRNTDDPDNPHGGAMWVADRGFAQHLPQWAWLGKVIAVVFCITLLTAGITGGNMAQAYNVAEATNQSFHVPHWVSGSLLALLCGMVIIGGIRVIGRVAGFIVPFMCAAYLIAGIVALIVLRSEIPNTIYLIFTSAFGGTANNGGAFIGGTWGMAFSWGMKRAFFSNEAGQGSAPIAHSAAKTDEPAREGLVAGIGPFIDTLVVCTITALVILCSNAWNREADGYYSKTVGEPVAVTPIVDSNDPEARFIIEEQQTALPQRKSRQWHTSKDWVAGEEIFILVRDGTDSLRRIHGKVVRKEGDEQLWVLWQQNDPVRFLKKPTFESNKDGSFPVYVHYVAASLTSHAFDRAIPGLGFWLVPIAVWFFALSTVISWSYYGEQGVVYMFGMRWVMPYRFLYCGFLFLATLGIITTERELANYTDLGTGTMLLANLPICLIFGRQTMRAYFDYIGRLRAGEFHKNP